MEEPFRATSSPVQGRFGHDRTAPDARAAAFSHRSLETFVDLGLTDKQIARYFRTSETRIVSLRRHYGLS